MFARHSNRRRPTAAHYNLLLGPARGLGRRFLAFFLPSSTIVSACSSLSTSRYSRQIGELKNVNIFPKWSNLFYAFSRTFDSSRVTLPRPSRASRPADFDCCFLRHRSDYSAKTRRTTAWRPPNTTRCAGDARPGRSSSRPATLLAEGENRRR